MNIRKGEIVNEHQELKRRRDIHIEQVNSIRQIPRSNRVKRESDAYELEKDKTATTADPYKTGTGEFNRRNKNTFYTARDENRLNRKLGASKNLWAYKSNDNITHSIESKTGKSFYTQRKMMKSANNGSLRNDNFSNFMKPANSNFYSKIRLKTSQLNKFAEYPAISLPVVRNDVEKATMSEDTNSPKFDPNVYIYKDRPMKNSF